MAIAICSTLILESLIRAQRSGKLVPGSDLGCWQSFLEGFGALGFRVVGSRPA